MSVGYKAITWDAQKKYYDCTLAVVLAVLLLGFIVATLFRSPSVTAETLIIRGTALAAFTLLHVILCIGPLARLDARFIPLLYNRRHLGVAMFHLALIHSILVVIQFHVLGNKNPFVSLFTAYANDYWPFARAGGMLGDVPFEPFGLLALLILFLMAATSHDFWLKHLGASIWKTLHLGVYLAYGCLLAHVAFGILQAERNPWFIAVTAGGMILVTGLHLLANRREARIDRQSDSPEADGFVRTLSADVLTSDCGTVTVVRGRRIALYLHAGRIYAISNVCRHQGGPIGEGCVVDGVVTCPWHGWQYHVDTGVSPPPFEEKLPTYPVRLHQGVVYVHPQANPLGQSSPGVADSSSAATLPLTDASHAQA